MVVNAATGQVERRRASGSNVSHIEMSDLNLAPITNVADVITGRAAGLTLQSPTGSIGSSQRIRIRGASSLNLSNEPLVFVDGIRVSAGLGGFNVGGQETSRLNDIDPTDIANIEVVKGPAAAALYGTAAASGVILITTKRGHSGDANWSFYVETSRLSDETEYAANYFPYQLNTPGAPLFNDDDGYFNTDARSACYNYQAAEGACTQDSLFVFNTMMDPRTRPLQDGFARRTGLSVAGGGDRVTYYISGDFEKSEGVISINNEQKINLRTNLNAQIRNDLQAALSIGYTDNALVLNNDNNSIFSPLINGVLGSAVYFPPEADGSVNRRNYGFGFSVADLEELPTEQEVDRFIMGMKTTYTPRSWLSAALNIGLDLADVHDFDTLQPNRLPIAESFAIGFRESERTNQYNYSGTGTISGTFEPLESLVSTTTIGANYHREFLRSTYGYGAGIVESTEDLGASSTLFSVDESFFEATTLGAFAEQQFSYDNRIFLSGALRGDDNSAFGADFGFVVYPAVNASWVIGEEDWFPKNEYIGDLRLRAGWGKSGQRPNFRDALTYYDPIAVRVGGEETSGLALSSTGNPNLEPETVTGYEMGFDLGLLNNRIGVQFTYYNRESEEGLVRRRLPPSLGLTASVFDNLVSLRNRGTELAINALVLNLDDVQLDMTFSNATFNNKILELGEGVEDIILNRGEQRHREGYPAGAFFQPCLEWDDANGDGLLARDEVGTTADVEYIGPSTPTYARTLSANLTLFDFVTFTTLFEARGGNYQLDGTTSFACSSAQDIIASGCYQMSVASAPLEQQAAFIGDRFLGTAAGFIFPADFIKWREASITFNMPDRIYSAVPQLRGLALTLSGRNLATWTDYPGIDPEVNEQGASTNFNQNEFNTQPPLRYLTARLTYRF